MYLGRRCSQTNNKTQRTAIQELQVQSLLPVFPEQSSFQTHAHDDNKPSIKLQDADVPQLNQNKLNEILNHEFACIVSKLPTDFGRTNLVEMDLLTTGPPIATKLYSLPLKYKSFMVDKIKLLECCNTACIQYIFVHLYIDLCIILTTVLISTSYFFPVIPSMPDLSYPYMLLPISITNH